MKESDEEKFEIGFIQKRNQFRRRLSWTEPRTCATEANKPPLCSLRSNSPVINSSVIFYFTASEKHTDESLPRKKPLKVVFFEIEIHRW